MNNSTITNRFVYVFLVLCFFVFLLPGFAESGAGQTVRVVNYNVWHGIDGVGTFKMGEYETPQVRRARNELLVMGLQELNPHILGIQEANKVGPFSRSLARALGHKAVWKVGNSGVKLFGLGIPVNFTEGLAVLAQRDQEIRYLGGQRLSGGGVQSRFFSAHLSEVRNVMAALVTIHGNPVIVFNTHTHFSLIMSPQTEQTLDRFIAEGKIDPSQRQEILNTLEQRNERTESDIRQVAAFIRRITEKHSYPFIVMGDFNTTLESRALSELVQEFGLLDPYALMNPGSPGYTWDPQENPNTFFDGAPHFAEGTPKEGVDLLIADFDISTPRRIDFIFLSSHFTPDMVISADLVFHEPVNGIFVSDHFGIMVELSEIPGTP